MKISLKAKLLSTLGLLASVGVRLIVQSVKKMLHDLGCRDRFIYLTRMALCQSYAVAVTLLLILKRLSTLPSTWIRFIDSSDLLACFQWLTSDSSPDFFSAIRAVRPRYYQHKQLIIEELCHLASPTLTVVMQLFA